MPVLPPWPPLCPYCLPSATKLQHLGARMQGLALFLVCVNHWRFFRCVICFWPLWPLSPWPLAPPRPQPRRRLPRLRLRLRLQPPLPQHRRPRLQQQHRLRPQHRRSAGTWTRAASCPWARASPLAPPTSSAAPSAKAAPPSGTPPLRPLHRRRLRRAEAQPSALKLQKAPFQPLRIDTVCVSPCLSRMSSNSSALLGGFLRAARCSAKACNTDAG